jgi:hypothetical protein
MQEIANELDGREFALFSWLLGLDAAPLTLTQIAELLRHISRCATRVARCRRARHMFAAAARDTSSTSRDGSQSFLRSAKRRRVSVTFVSRRHRASSQRSAVGKETRSDTRRNVEALHC